MTQHNQFSPDEYHRQGLEHFRRGEWQAAIAAFTKLQEAGESYPGTEELLADARFKLHLDGAEAPRPRRAPWGPLLRRALVALLVCLIAIPGIGGWMLVRPEPDLVAAMPSPTEAPPTTTSEAVVAATPAPPAAAVAQEAPGVIVQGTLSIMYAEGTSFVSGPDNIEIIMDASGSMLSQMAGSDRQRWQVAQEALTNLISAGGISEQSAVALRTFGRQRSRDCSDMEVMQPLGRFDRDTLLNAVGAIKPVPFARTPLAASMRAASDDLAAAAGATALIVVTDGDETCDGDPAAEAANFVNGRPDRHVHVIGFALDNPVDAPRLQQIAANGNGVYLEANNSAELVEALRQTLRLNYRVLAQDGSEVAGGTVGDAPIQLNPGVYRLQIDATEALETELVIENGGAVEVRLRKGFTGLLAEVGRVSP